MDKKWYKRFLTVAHEVASWSKDDSTKVGAIIIGPNKIPRSFGYNGFPRGVNDAIEQRHQRPEKYKWMNHAEQNALDNCTREGISVKECDIYVTHHPCSSCARSIIQTGIKRVIIDGNSLTPAFLERWKDDIDTAQEMLLEAGVEIIIV